MEFTERQFQLGSSGAAKALVAAHKACRSANFGDSMMTDQNPGRYPHGMMTMSQPRRHNGVFRSGYAAGACNFYLAATNSAPLTSAATPEPITDYVLPLTYGEFLGTTGNANNKGLVPEVCQEYVFGTNVALDALVGSAQLFPWQVHGTDGNTSTGYDPYSGVGQAKNPFWWMDGIDVVVYLYDPSVANNGVAGPDIYISRGRAVSGVTKDTALGTSGTVTGGTGGVVVLRTSIAATVNPLDFPKVEIRSAVQQSTKRLIVLGFMFERTDRTTKNIGLSQFFFGIAGLRAGNWADTTAVRSSVLRAMCGPLSNTPVDVFTLCVGHNLTSAQNTELASGFSATMLADLQADVARIRADLGNIPGVLWAPYKYDSTISATKYSNIVDTMYRACVADSKLALFNPYTGVWDDTTFIDATGGQAVVTNRSFSAGDRHVIQEGAQAMCSMFWETVLDAYEERRISGTVQGPLRVTTGNRKFAVCEIED